MSSPLRLDKALTQGVLRYINLEHLAIYRPPVNHVAMLLNGTLTHKTATDSILWHRRWGQPTLSYFMHKTLAAVVNGTYPLWNTEPDQSNPQFSILFIDRDHYLQFVGDAAASMQLLLLEWMQ